MNNYFMRVAFWIRNGFCLAEAMIHAKHTFPRKVWVELKKLRIENTIRKKNAVSR